MRDWQCEALDATQFSIVGWSRFLQPFGESLFRLLLAPDTMVDLRIHFVPPQLARHDLEARMSVGEDSLVHVRLAGPHSVVDGPTLADAARWIREIDVEWSANEDTFTEIPLLDGESAPLSRTLETYVGDFDLSETALVVFDQPFPAVYYVAYVRWGSKVVHDCRDR